MPLSIRHKLEFMELEDSPLSSSSLMELKLITKETELNKVSSIGLIKKYSQSPLKSLMLKNSLLLLTVNLLRLFSSQLMPLKSNPSKTSPEVMTITNITSPQVISWTLNHLESSDYSETLMNKPLSTETSLNSELASLKTPDPLLSPSTKEQSNQSSENLSKLSFLLTQEALKLRISEPPLSLKLKIIKELSSSQKSQYPLNNIEIIWAFRKIRRIH